MSSSRSSLPFKSAVAYLSNSPNLSKVSNDVKLELYALYKCITVSRRPPTSRPSLFDFTARAKWDAWDKLGRESDYHAGTDEELLVNRYIEIARSLGWKDNNPTELKLSDSGNVDTLPSDRDGGNENGGGGAGTGIRVSVVSGPNVPTENTLHGRVLENDVKQVLESIEADSLIDINAKDEYGYTPLHLAADRGYIDIVAVLLQKGADKSIKDPDDYTALELADLAGREAIKDMLT